MPQLLLRQFTNADGKLWVYDLKEGKRFPSNPADVGFVKDLYSRRNADGTFDHCEIEALLSLRVDGPGDSAIKRLLKHETLDADWNDFLIFVAAQILRTPAFFERTRLMAKATLQEMFDRMVNHSEEFQTGVHARALATGISENSINQALRVVREGHCTVEPTKEFLISSSFAQLEGYTRELRELGWAIASLHERDCDLVIADHPVLLIVPPGERVGLRNPSIEVVMPLSNRMVAIGAWNNEPKYTALKEGTAHYLNAKSLSFAQRFVFASFDSEELLADAKSLHGTGPKVRLKEIWSGPRLVQVHEYL